jgi:hypothetical protein
VIVAGKIIFIARSIYPWRWISACIQRPFSGREHDRLVPSSKEETMSKLMKATLIGLAAAALGAPLAHADAFKAPRDVGRPSDVSRPNPMKSAVMPNPLKMGSRPNPWKVGRMLPWASRNAAAY